MNEINDDWTLEELHNFREVNKLHSMTVNGFDWQYHDLTNCDNPLPFAFVFIHGTIGNAEIFWLQMRELSKRMRVIGVNVPPITSAEEISVQLKLFLDELSIKKIVLLGTSFGGFIGQYFAIKYPEIVKGLVLGNTFCSSQYYRMKFHRVLKLSRLIPGFIIKSVMKSPLKNIRHEAARQYLTDELFTTVSKDAIMARLKSFIFEDLVKPPDVEHVLIINTENDPLVPEELQTEIVNAYPDADIFTFDSSANHFPYLIQSKKYIQLLTDFVEKMQV